MSAEIKTVLTDEELFDIFEKARNGSDKGVGVLRGIRAIERAVLEAAPASSAIAMQAVDAADTARLEFMFSLPAKRIEQETFTGEPWFRVYQDAAPENDKDYMWRSMTPGYYMTPRVAIDEAMQSQQSPVQASDAGRQG